jgi:hypothetical protein
MGDVGHVSSFRRAVERGHYTTACELARALEPIELSDALRLTILAVEKEPDPARLDAMAVRTIGLMIERRQPMHAEVAALALGLQELREGRREGADLLQLERQMSWWSK